MEDRIHQLATEFTEKISHADSLAQLDTIYLELFGKNGVVTLLPKEFSQLDKDQLKDIGQLFNQVKSSLMLAVEKRRESVREEDYKKLDQEGWDLENAAKPNLKPGHIHPVIKFEQEIVELFKKLGFQQYDAPHIDSDEINFELLNIPQNHPARDLWDTLYIDKSNLKKSDENLILRTHTSNAQVRIMQQYKPPIRMMVLDRCFRYENLDARHEHTFEQFELVYIDKGLSMATLQYLSEYFFKHVFGEDTKVRMRPKYYPFVEPGVGVDGQCPFCKGIGCNICGGAGWLELAGAGMIHPKVLENGGIDPNIYSGIAWGMGPERMMMIKMGIDDIRIFKSGDLTQLYGEAL